MLRVMPQVAKEPHDWANQPKDWAEEQAHRVALEIRRLRGKRSAQWLADRTAELGSPVSRSVISDLEIGRRRYVTTAELIVLARALDTAPIALLYPFPYYEEGKVQVLPGQNELEKIVAVQWFTGMLDIFPLIELGMPMVDQENFFSNLQGLDRARKIFALAAKNEGLSVDLRLLRNEKRDGHPVADEEIDELVAVIDDNLSRIKDLLTLGDRDLAAESFDRFWEMTASRAGKRSYGR